MSNSSETKRGSWLTRAVAILLATPVLYVLSIGPVLRLAMMTSSSRDTILESPAFGLALTVYSPLLWLMEDCVFVESWLVKYAQLWSIPLFIPLRPDWLATL